MGNRYFYRTVVALEYPFNTLDLWYARDVDITDGFLQSLIHQGPFQMVFDEDALPAILEIVGNEPQIFLPRER